MSKYGPGHQKENMDKLIPVIEQN